MNDAPPTAISELARWKRWVCWKTVERDGKPTKVPLTPAGRPASSTDPSTWSSHQDCERALKNGRFDGIGYVFAEDDEYFGVDLDHCVADGVVHPDAMQIIQRLGSYTEFSPTGTGLHIIGRGAVNGKRNRTKKTPWGHDFEVYDRARFFTVTGRQLFGAPATIEARQTELEAVCAEMFPAPAKNGNGHAPLKPTAPVALDDVALEQKIRSSKQGPKFAELFDRGAPEGQESEADLALCNMLAFWLGPDETRIDAWFRRSALMRDKWDSPRGDTTYGGYTIDRALEGRTEFYTPGRGRESKAQPKDDDDPVRPDSERISDIFGLFADDPIVHGWRPKRSSNSRVVFTTRSGKVLDLDSWKKVTANPRTLSQEIRMQLGADVTLKKEDIDTLDILVGRFCQVIEAMTVDQRARELGEAFLQDAPTHPLDFSDQGQRFEAFAVLRERHPALKSKADGTSIAAESLVLVDRSSGIRYVRVQWFVDYVKANVVSGTAAAVMEAIEKPGWWSRPNTQSRFVARHPSSGQALSAVLFEVPAGWEEA